MGTSVKVLCVLVGVSLLGVAACADSIPEVQNATSQAEPLVVIVNEGASFNLSIYWPDVESGELATSPGDGILIPGSRHVVMARLPGNEWLRIADGWIEADRVRFVFGTLEQVPFVLTSGLWLISPKPDADLLLVTYQASWNSWQWDPQSGALWYRHSEASPVLTGHAPVSRMVLIGNRVYREHSHLSGDVLAASVGGAVLIRERFDRTAPHDNVHILDSDGQVHTIGQQCSGYFTDSYRPFGGDASWSPDGEYVVLRDRTGDLCETGGASIFNRSGLVEHDRGDSESPYQRAWYRSPNFTDQVRTDETCSDRPPGVVLNDRRNRCQWSPDRQWFATMPGLNDNPHLAELLIYDAQGALVNRVLIVGWPCNSFQWAPSSRWLAYGGPSTCA
ncbi:MAG: hypothetical protein OXD50_16790 [Chloroflexi bacterium]|nr:hypothetical protein [Chloroflexota bacterium]